MAAIRGNIFFVNLLLNAPPVPLPPVGEPGWFVVTIGASITVASVITLYVVCSRRSISTGLYTAYLAVIGLLFFLLFPLARSIYFFVPVMVLIELPTAVWLVTLSISTRSGHVGPPKAGSE